MTLQIGFLLAVLAVMVYLFLTEKLPVDLTAFLGLSVLILTGYLAPNEAFTGFASTAVITMLSIFIVSAALLETGFADLMGSKFHQWVGSQEIPLIIAIMLAAGILSAFMNNIAATAVLMPAVAAIARRAGLAPGRLFMPLAFGAILGGTTTLVGTPPNILAGAMLEERGLPSFSLFDFTPIGLMLLGLGILFMITFGRKLLPKAPDDDGTGTAAGATVELSEVYQLRERIFSIRIPEGSALDGVTLRAAKLGTALGVQVVAIDRDGKKQLAPDGSAGLAAGDILIAKGREGDLENLLEVQSVELQKTNARDLPPPDPNFSAIRVRVLAGSPLAGWSLRELGFRARFGVVVVGIQRGDQMIRENLAREVLVEDDRLLALGTRINMESFASQPGVEVREEGMAAVQKLFPHLFLIRIPDDSPMVGKTIGSSRLGELVGLTIGGIVRDGENMLAVSPDEPLRGGDRLVVAGEPDRIISLLDLGKVQLETSVSEPTLTSENVGIVEAVVAPRSAAAGKTLAELGFRSRYGLQVLAISRQGRDLRRNLAAVRLEFGDALLLQGSRKQIDNLAANSDYVVLSATTKAQRRTKKAPYALAGLALMVGMVITGWQPIHVAAFVSASLVVLSGALKMHEAYRAIEWRAIFLVAAVLPVGIAIERTGAAALLAGGVTETAGPLGPYAVLAALIFLSSALSQALDGAPAVVLLTPVLLQAAEQLNLSPLPLMMGVSLAASAAFMTPFSHKANLLVMGAGGYRSMDYVRVGTPLTIVLLILMVFTVPIFFPF